MKAIKFEVIIMPLTPEGEVNDLTRNERVALEEVLVGFFKASRQVSILPVVLTDSMSKKNKEED